MSSSKQPTKKTLLDPSISETDLLARAMDKIDGNIPAGHILPIALSAAVPLWIVQLYTDPNRETTRQQWIDHASAVLLETGEAILYKTKPGESERAFNAVAKSIAALAFCPGGVTLFGMHWEA